MGRTRKKTKLEQLFEKNYFGVKHPGSLGGVDALSKQTGKKPKVVEKWLTLQDTYTLHKPVRYRFKRRKVVVGGIDHQWQLDLVDVSRIAKHNGNHHFILTCIDVLSKYAWAVPLKNKSGDSLVQGFKSILADGRKPLRVQSDQGKEFTNFKFQNHLKSEGITFFTTYNEETKAQICERFNRTLKTKMWKYFTHHDTLRYLDVLPDLMESYNKTYHRSIGMAPVSANRKNQETVWQTLYGKSEPLAKQKFFVGDKVRLSKTRRVFKKGYLPSWTDEIFTVVECRKGSPWVYMVKDDEGQVLEGTFYAEELQKVVKKDRVYKIEAILEERKRGRGVQVLVKWKGYKTPTWINKRDLRAYKR